MRICLIQPKYIDDMWSTLGKMCNKELVPPLALLTIAALTPEPHDIEVIDENTDPIDFSADYDVVALTSFTAHALRAYEISQRFRERGVVTVIGGSHASQHTEECQEHFDVVFKGEAELTWPAFLEDLQRGDYRSLYWQEDPIDLTVSPMPRWDLVDLRNYYLVSIQTTRGCTFDCEFCSIVATMGRSFRHKSVEQVLEEVREVRRRGISTIFLADDNLIGNKPFVKELLRAFITHFDDLSLSSQVSINITRDEEMLELFHQAGFSFIFVGIESTSRENHVIAKKMQNAHADLLNDLRKLQSYGILVYGGFIVGMDEDTPAVFDETLEFIQQAPVVVPIIAQLNAPKGTRLYTRLQQANRLLDLPLADDHTTGRATNILPNKITSEELFTGWQKLFQECYTYRNFEQRLDAFLANFARTPKYNGAWASRESLGILWRIVKSLVVTTDLASIGFFTRVFFKGLRKNQMFMSMYCLAYFCAYREFLDKQIRPLTYVEYDRLPAEPQPATELVSGELAVLK